jgi:hypothetical protein
VTKEVDDEGRYSFTVSPGTYKVQPFGFEGKIYSPQSTVVVVTNADQTADFADTTEMIEGERIE